ncbi:UNVERIFIED_CONTAM: hypothetical protein GTU68_045180 [Idotea baltica]|nr:hypothetical protein [Idotea baltica]
MRHYHVDKLATQSPISRVFRSFGH